MSLFQGESIHGVLQRSLMSAVRAIEQVGLTALSDPALAGRIEKLWASHRPDVPVIFPDQRTGERREDRVARNDYGQRVLVPITYVDVQVPYKGDASLFKVMPSRSPTIDERIMADAGRLSFSLNLDEASKEQIDKLLAKIEANLQQMRIDVGHYGKSALEQLARAAADRKYKLAAYAEQMKKLGL